MHICLKWAQLQHSLITSLVHPPPSVQDGFTCSRTNRGLGLPTLSEILESFLLSSEHFSSACFRLNSCSKLNVLLFWNSALWIYCAEKPNKTISGISLKASPNWRELSNRGLPNLNSIRHLVISKTSSTYTLHTAVTKYLGAGCCTPTQYWMTLWHCVTLCDIVKLCVTLCDKTSSQDYWGAV